MPSSGITTSFHTTGVARLLAQIDSISNEHGQLEKLTQTTFDRTGRGVIVPAIASHTPHKYGGHGGKYPTKGLLSKKQKITGRKVRLRQGEFVARSFKPRFWFAHMVIQGTRPHVISARGMGGVRASNATLRRMNKGVAGRAEALYFGGRFASKVQHPGAEPTDYVHEAAQGKEQALMDALAQDLVRQMDRAKGSAPASP
jgi:hypothetical protein